MRARTQGRLLAVPGLVWLGLFVVVPTYALLAVATGSVDILQRPVPAWNPADRNASFLVDAFGGALPGGAYWPALSRTLIYVGAAMAGCVVIGYPVAYYVARHARGTKVLLLVLLVLPFLVSYLLRMLAWIGLLSGDGYVNRVLGGVGVANPPDWLNGNAYSVVIALIYGYLPFFILPVFAGLDRIDGALLDAARDLGASPLTTFWTVTLPLSWPSVVAGLALVALPMSGDYFTNDLISASPRTAMLGNQINLFVQDGPQKNLGAALVLVLVAILSLGMAYYLRVANRATRRWA